MTKVIINETSVRILSRSLFNSNSAQPMELIISENIAHPRKLKKYLGPVAVDVSSSRFVPQARFVLFQSRKPSLLPLSMPIL